MRLRLDPTTPIPPFEQIRAQLALHVAAGRLRPGDRLPTIRTLAAELEVSANTVARAYRVLISSGIARAAGRAGTFIADAPPVAHGVVQRNMLLEDAALDFARVARESGAGLDETIEALLRATRQLDGTMSSAGTRSSLQTRTGPPT